MARGTHRPDWAVAALWQRVGALSLALMLGFGALPGKAGDHPTVLELFTSQGCTACPPADYMARKLADSDDIIVLALHVDIWDYLGWRDVFAKPAFSARQRAYARSAQLSSVFTPHIVIQGNRHVIGYRPEEVMAHIARARTEREPVELRLERAGDMLRIHVVPLAAAVGAADVELVRYTPRAEVVIERGENAGRTALHANIVTEWTHLLHWDGTADLVHEVPLPDGGPFVVLVQRRGNGAILAARRLR